MFSIEFEKHIRTKAFLLLLFFSPLGQLLANDYFIVNEISISGKKWTRTYIVEKELDFSPGDTIFLENISERFEANKNRLYNTGLFNHVEISITNWEPAVKKADIRIELVENWFWYPSPIVELGDRSFNEWVYQHNASLKRINLGLRFMHINLSGNADNLKFNFHTGFTKKYEVDYRFPYLNKKHSLGAYFNVMYVTHDEVAYKTAENKLVFAKAVDDILLTRFRTSLGLNYRKNKTVFQSFLAEYHRKTIADTIHLELNPGYFGSGTNSLEHIRLKYTYLFSKVDKRVYPTSGYRYLFDLQKDGVGLFDDLNHLQLTAAFEKHYKVSDHYSVGAKVKARKTLNFGEKIPYSQLRGLGYYDDVLSGYHLYVVDGVNFIYLKTFQKIRFFNQTYRLGKAMPLHQFRIMPLQLYFGIHGDLGYAQEDGFSDINQFNNRLLAGAGISLDIVVYQNYFFSCELAVNHLGEVGVSFNGINTFAL